MLLLLVNTPFGTTQDVVVGQLGPVTTICAVEVLKLHWLPVADWPPSGQRALCLEAPDEAGGAVRPRGQDVFRCTTVTLAES